MGNKGSNEKRINKSIQKKLDDEHKLLSINVLLLGPGGGGKTTILKQMKRIHGIKTGLPTQERDKSKYNLIESSSSSILPGMGGIRETFDTDDTNPLVNKQQQQQQQQYESKDKEESLTTTNSSNDETWEELMLDIEVHILTDIRDICKWNIKGRKEKSEEYQLQDKSLEPIIESLAHIQEPSLVKNESYRLHRSLPDLVERLWKDKGIRQTYEDKKIFYDMDNTPYFFERVHLYADPNYKCTFEDYVRVRDRTVGVIMTPLISKERNHEIRINVTDVCGQRAERKKWLPLFEGTDAILWVMSLASYDQMLFEDNTKNRYDEAFELFEEHCHHKNLQKPEFVVFLNKYDILEQKLLTVPFTKYDRNFDENKASDPQAVIEYVQKKHEDAFHRKERNAALYFYVTCATNNNLIEKVIDSVKFSWLKTVMQSSGIL